ncbi:MAG: penicillin-binding protein 2 [Betaproteobacteria bacterium]|uniref:Peptidoglycan D,D-transpeptidase MrdA n=1 Tax=Candidatus Proximibacter danicus TaxID=2954365 RepID=A0A9D7K333_9PROT|nr:penicillin-binding protein 2 [Candidatus Proximibacter danicus]MBK9447285.1 penicillin-binding protein 2 [Betaproteobacteria bacterium]
MRRRHHHDAFHHQDSDLYRFRFRLGFAAVAVLIAFTLLFARFFWLQVIQHDYYATRAEGNRISLVPVTPNRGVIVDRNGTVMARNYSAFTLEITPSKVRDLEASIEELSRLIEIQTKDRKRFKKLMDESKNFESIPIRTRLTDKEVAKFAANRYRFPGIEVKARLFRQYPLGEVGSHALGYIGRVNDRDLDTIRNAELEANYKGTDHFGKSGLEQKYEFALHGKTGYEEVEIDAGGRAVRNLSRTAPVPGNNLTLTLDAKLQAITEQAFGDRRGALVAIEPETGGILALVSKPTFDPNLFVDGIRTDDWDAYNTNPDKPMINRAIYGTYPPGSTFKPFMALAALETGKRTPQQSISDPGYFNFGGHHFRDDKVGGHGMVDMYKSIVHSCDTYYYMLANDMGIENIANFMGQLGLGQRTGIDIEGESEGVLPSQAWKKRRFKRPEQQKWYAGETISIGIGQGYNSYTPLQLALATATVANNGVMFRPHIVKYIVDSKSGEKSMVEPEPIRRLPFKQQNIDVIKKAMVGVNKEGTGGRAFAGAEYESGGKTGTAQVYSLKGEKYEAGKVKERLRDHALFVAFAPADKPKIALAVLVENGGFGAQSAAPIARMVIDYYLLGKLPKGAATEDESAVEADE